MGTDCTVFIPNYVEARYIADAIGVICGLPYSTFKIDMTEMRMYKSVSIQPSSKDFGMGKIQFVYPNGHFLASGALNGIYIFLQSTKAGKVWTLLLARATASGMALFRKLAKFFGGIIQSEQSNTEETYEVSHVLDKDGILGEFTSNQWWRKFWEQLYAIEPLTIEDIQAEKDNGRYSDPLLDLDYLPMSNYNV